MNSSVEAQYKLATEIDVDEENEEKKHRRSSLADKLTWVLICTLAIGMPLAFGAVHPPAKLIAQTLTFLAVAVILILSSSRISSVFAKKTTSRHALCLLGSFFICLLIAQLFHSYTSSPHPVLGSFHPYYNPLTFWSCFFSMFFFLGVFYLARLWLSDSSSRSKKLVTLLNLITLAVGMVALSHWFYDNGKLFWTFAPETVEVSNRARWPFVNPNHLAHFMLPLVFLLAAQIVRAIYALQDLATSELSRRNIGMARLLGNHSIQSRSLALLFLGTLGLTGVLCIIGSLSRGAWAGASVGILVFAILNYLPNRSTTKPKAESFREPASYDDKDTPIDINDPLPQSHHRSHRKKHHHTEGNSKTLVESITLTLSRFSVPVLIAFACLVFIFFLQNKGRELFAERVEFGLMSSKDDMRWQLYSDSIPLIKEHLALGVGAGNWNSVYPKYMDKRLAGINPEYMHSDPMQFVAEFGAPAFCLILLMVLALLILVIRKCLDPGISRQLRVMNIGLTAGLISLIVASCLDFPFHIPAMAFYSGLYLALLVYYLEKEPK